MKTLGLFFFFPKKAFVSIPLALFFFGSDAKLGQKQYPIAFQKLCLKKKRKPTPQFTYVFAELISFLQFHSKQSINQSQIYFVPHPIIYFTNLFEFVVQIFINRIDGVPVNLVANFVNLVLSFFLSFLLRQQSQQASALWRMARRLD